MEKENKTKFLYVTAITGQRIKVPLKDYVNEDYIMQQLLNAGVSYENMKYCTFSKLEPVPVGKLSTDFTSRAKAEANDPSPFPKYPKPSGPDEFPAKWSSLKIWKYTPLKDLRNGAGGTGRIDFCMKKPDGKSVNIWGFKDSEWQFPAQLKEINDGKVGLLYATAWQMVDIQKIIEGDEYKQEKIISRGMKETTMYSITATVGASGFGLSASLSATFGQTFEINKNEEYSETFSSSGVKDKTKIYALWQLVDLFYLVKPDGNGGYNFIDSYTASLWFSDHWETVNADPLFFGNNELMDNGRKIGTNMIHATTMVQSDTTLFPKLK